MYIISAMLLISKKERESRIYEGTGIKLSNVNCVFKQICIYCIVKGAEGLNLIYRDFENNPRF